MDRDQSKGRISSARQISNTALSIFLLIATAFIASSNIPSFAQSTVLPTETLNSGAAKFGTHSKFQSALLRKLPANFYLDASVETTFRLETNPFQTRTKRSLLNQQLPPGSDPDPSTIISLQQELKEISATDQVFRVNPNVTTGWSFTPNTQVFATYFLIRDSLFHGSKLNSNTQAVGLGAQYTQNLSKRLSLQYQFTARELFQTEQIPVFDYLPAITLQYQATDNLVAYVNPLLQLRFRHFMGDPMRELDTFYTWGLSYTKGPWSLTASTTFNQNFRRPFRKAALLPIDNYSFISDFEIDRDVSKKIPGLQAVLRVEPLWNFHGGKTTGLAGMDFRLYYGLRFSASKPALTSTIDQLKQRYLQTQEGGSK